MTRILSLTLIFLSVAAFGASRDDPERTILTQQNHVVEGKNHMVVAANPHAAKAGYDILLAGGTAMDAAVAVQTTLNLVEPQSSGIGGGTFIMYYEASSKQLFTLDAREKAPLKATPDMFYVDGKPLKWWEAIQGGLSVGVPGVVKGLEVGQQRFGKLPWESLFDSAIDLATRGFEVSPRLAQLVQMELHPSLKRMPVAADYFYPNGQALQAGQILKNPELAKSLSQIAKQGSSAFYQGQLAEQIVAAVNNSPIRPGLMSLEDLAEYEPVWREPLCADYRDQTLCGMAPPSSGGLAVLQIMGILEHFPLTNHRIDDPQMWHVFTQAARVAFADRQRYAADEDFVDVPLEALLDKAYLKKRAEMIDIQHDSGLVKPLEIADKLSLADDDALELPSTSHYVIADRYGNVLSATTSIEMGFGSSVMVGGFLLNNQLTDFSLSPEINGKLVANSVAASKRPRSSMSPMIVFEEGKPTLLIGSPGGTRIINYVAKSLIAILDFDLDIQSAIDLPNISQTNSNKTHVELNTAGKVLAQGLAHYGHDVDVRDMNSGLHVIQLTSKHLLGAADPRREGAVYTDQ